MERVTGYKTTDGQMFADRKLAKEHQAKLNIIDGLSEIGKRMDDDGSFFVDDFGCAAICEPETFAEFVIKHFDDIAWVMAGKALKDKVPEGVTAS